jgi:hypothetical protein
MTCTRTVYNCTKLLAQSSSAAIKVNAPIDVLAR